MPLPGKAHAYAENGEPEAPVLNNEVCKSKTMTYSKGEQGDSWRAEIETQLTPLVSLMRSFYVPELLKANVAHGVRARKKSFLSSCFA